MLDTGLLRFLLMWVKISNGSEFMQGKSLGCPSVILMWDSDLVNYLCYFRAEVFDIMDKCTVVVGLISQ